MKKNLRYLAAGLVLIVALFSTGCVKDLGPELLGTTWSATPVTGTTMSIVIGTQNQHVGFLVGHINLYDAVINYSDGTNTYTWNIPITSDLAAAAANVKSIRANNRAESDTPAFSLMNFMFDANIIAAYAPGDGTTTPPIVLAGTYESGTSMTLDVYIGESENPTFTGLLFE